MHNRPDDFQAAGRDDDPVKQQIINIYLFALKSIAERLKVRPEDAVANIDIAINASQGSDSQDRQAAIHLLRKYFPEHEMARQRICRIALTDPDVMTRAMAIGCLAYNPQLASYETAMEICMQIVMNESSLPILKQAAMQTLRAFVLGETSVTSVEEIRQIREMLQDDRE